MRKLMDMVSRRFGWRRFRIQRVATVGTRLARYRR